MIYLEWYFAGPLLGLIVLGMIVTLNVQLGVSGSLEYIVVSVKDGKLLNNEKGQLQLYFIGGLIIATVLIHLSGLVTSTPLDTEVYSTANGIVLAAGSFLIGFGSRLANGCTSGHCIMGLSIQSKSSLVATAGFFTGGLLSSHFINELIFSL